MTDVGPFQEVIGINFPAPDNPEDFVFAEDLLIRSDCADADTEVDTGNGVSRVPNSGTNVILCICTDPTFGGGYDCYQLIFRIPLTEDYPACVIGGTSGAKIRKDWPGEPPGWGSGSPDPFSTPAGLCASPQWQSGQVVGLNYEIRMTFCSNCQPGAAAPDDCCG